MSATPPAAPPAAVSGPEPVSFQQLKDSWPEILETVGKANRAAWIVIYTGSVRALAGDVLTLTFPSQNDVDNFKQQHSPGQGVSEFLRQAIVEVLGLRVKFIARVDASNTSAERAGDPQPEPGATDRAGASSTSSAGAPPAPAADTSVGRDAPGRLAGARAPAATPTRADAPTAATASAPVAAAPATPRAAPPSGSTARASWPVVAIPVSAPEPGDEPVRAGAITVDIPISEIPEDIPEGDIPDYDPPSEWASADEQVPFASVPSDAQPAPTRPGSGVADRPASGRPASGRPASGRPASDRPSPDRRTPPARAAAPDRPVPQFGEKQRYGEAVVREILGASFIEERPVAPRPAPNREG